MLKLSVRAVLVETDTVTETDAKSPGKREQGFQVKGSEGMNNAFGDISKVVSLMGPSRKSVKMTVKKQQQRDRFLIKKDAAFILQQRHQYH